MNFYSLNKLTIYIFRKTNTNFQDSLLLWFGVFFLFGCKLHSQELKIGVKKNDSTYIYNDIKTSQRDSILLKYQLKGYLNVSYEWNKSKQDSTKFDLILILRKPILWVSVIENAKENSKTISWNDYLKLIDKKKNELELQGRLFDQIHPKDLGIKNDTLFVKWTLKERQTRRIDKIVFSESKNFPANFTKRWKKDFEKKTLNQKNLDRLYQASKSIGFMAPIKYPEVLFTNDSSKVYVSFTKNNWNQAEGIIGFNNDEQGNLKWNGFLDLTLYNTFQMGEKFHLDWRNNGFGQNNLELKIQLPYLFGSKIGTEADLHIFRQDSTFQTTNLKWQMSYLWNMETSLFVGIQTTESSDIQNINNNTLQDFENQFYFIGLQYQFRRETIPNLIPTKYTLKLQSGFGNRTTNTQKTNQWNLVFQGQIRWDLDQRNSLFIKGNGFYLQSENYLINELPRFGGINNIRGFIENSIQASTFSSLASEYQLKLGTNFYIHSIIDYGYFEDKSSNLKNNLKSFGIGFGLQNKNSIFNLQFANGIFGNQDFDFQNTLTHLSFKTFF